MLLFSPNLFGSGMFSSSFWLFFFVLNFSFHFPSFCWDFEAKEQVPGRLKAVVLDLWFLLRRTLKHWNQGMCSKLATVSMPVLKLYSFFELTALLSVVKLVICCTLWREKKIKKNKVISFLKRSLNILKGKNLLLHPMVGDSIPIFGEKLSEFLVLLNRTSQRACFSHTKNSKY